MSFPTINKPDTSLSITELCGAANESASPHKNPPALPCSALEVLDALSANVAILDNTGKILAVNRAWRSFAAANSAQNIEFVGVNYLDLCDQAYVRDSVEARQAAEGIRSVLQGRQSRFELEYSCHSAEEKRWFKMQVTPIAPRETRLVFVSHENITDCQLVEDALREADFQLQESQIIAGLGTCVLDTSTDIWKSSAVFNKLVGIDEAYQQRNFEGLLNLIHPEDRKGVADYFWNFVFSQNQPFDKEFRIIRRDDQAVCWVHGFGKLELDANMYPIKMHGAIMDITERKHNEELLKQSESRAISVIEASPDAIIIMDLQGGYRYVNEMALRLLDYTRSTMLGMTLGDISLDEDLPANKAFFQELISTGSLHAELRLKRKCGDTIMVDANAKLLWGDRVLFSCRDISLRKSLEAEQERHRAVLVREVDHRIKNNLQGVAGLLHRELGNFTDFRPRLEAAISQIESIAIIHGLQAANSDESISLGNSLNHICKFIGELMYRPLRLQINDEQAADIQAQIRKEDAVSVALVLNELILNAVKHSPAGDSAPTVTLLGNDAGVEVNIRNAVTEPPIFDFRGAKGLGSGLSLVQYLLPSDGADLTFALEPTGLMVTSLKLFAPLLVKQAGKAQN